MEKEKIITATYYTLGCKLNFAETSAIGRRLREIGIRNAIEGEQADICVINTCTVTEDADRKGRQLIRRVVRENPDAFVVVTGCYAQLKPREIAAIDGVDLVLGSEQKANIIDYLKNYKQSCITSGYQCNPCDRADRRCDKMTDYDRCSVVDNIKGSRSEVSFSKQESKSNDAIIEPDGVIFQSSRSVQIFTTSSNDIRTFAPALSSEEDRTRYFLKVQDGCNYFCTYCTIPFARGRSRNSPTIDIVKEVEQAVSEGCKEVVLSGVNIGDFGRSTGETFFQLLQALVKVDGIERYRISSIEPDLLSDDIINFVADCDKIAPHFHIPLQSGSDRVLRLMKRHYNTALFRHKIDEIKRLMPDAFIGVDVMAGMRGETDECFEESLAFLRSIDVSKLHVFTYSERPGTQALKIFPIVSQRAKNVRSRRLLELSDLKLRNFYASQRGSRRLVLFERALHGTKMHGFTENYVRVFADYNPMLVNKLCPVTIGEYSKQEGAMQAIF